MATEEATAAENAGEATAAPTAGKYTDDDMAKLRRSYEAKMTKAAEQAKSAAVSSLLGELGVGDAEELRDMLEAAKGTQTAASQTETELKKAQREAEKSAKALAEAQAKLADYDARTKKAQSKDAIFAAAAKVGAYEDDVWAHLRDRVVVSDDGSVVGADGTEVDTLVTSLVADRRNLLRPSPGAGGAGSLPSGNGKSAPDMLNPAAREAALRAAGLIP